MPFVNFSRLLSFKLMIILFLCWLMFLCYVHIKWTKAIDQDGLFKSSKFKKILFWNSFFGQNDFDFGLGNDPFFDHQCSEPYCYITRDRDWIELDQFDAVVFHGPELNLDALPRSRSANQRYVYVSMESPSNRAISPSLEYFYNWTMTYRIDSDINLYYFTIRDKENVLISPSEDPNWIRYKMNNSILNTYVEKFKTKTRPVAWFVSNCQSKNGRENRVHDLMHYIPIDVYGKCGTIQCPRNNSKMCFNMLRKDYFFYLSYENSNCRDYVTEKVTNAINHNVIPIVYGGANWSKFLPPHSYIDASEYSANALAQKLYHLMNSPKDYAKFFWWKEWYYTDKGEKPFCKLCEMLHKNNEMNKAVDIYRWWHGDDEHPTCSDS